MFGDKDDLYQIYQDLSKYGVIRLSSKPVKYRISEELLFFKAFDNAKKKLEEEFESAEKDIHIKKIMEFVVHNHYELEDETEEDEQSDTLTIHDEEE